MHRWSQLFIPTLREAPADAEVASHKFLVRAGYIRQLAAGLYSFLFLGNRTILRITQIVREEMDRIGQEFYLPALHPREIWEASGRWQVMGDNMFRLKDRGGRDLCLGMTEEEVMTEIARKELRSYKQLPQIWYQIQQKFRDEPRPKSGLLRVRQFSRVIGGIPITVFETKKTAPHTFDLRLTVYRDPTDVRWNYIQQTINQRLKAYDFAGQSMPIRGMSSRGDAANNQMEFTLTLVGNDLPTGEPSRLDWEIPTETRLTTVPFEFKDLPMPR